MDRHKMTTEEDGSFTHLMRKRRQESGASEVEEITTKNGSEDDPTHLMRKRRQESSAEEVDRKTTEERYSAMIHNELYMKHNEEIEKQFYKFVKSTRDMKITKDEWFYNNIEQIEKEILKAQSVEEFPRPKPSTPGSMKDNGEIEQHHAYEHDMPVQQVITAGHVEEFPIPKPKFKTQIQGSMKNPAEETLNKVQKSKWFLANYNEIYKIYQEFKTEHSGNTKYKDINFDN